MSIVLNIDLLRGERLMGRYRFTEDKHQLVKIGKIPSSHIFLEGPQVSRLHAVIEFRDDGPWVVDMGTMSGTLLNGQPVERSLLEDGDAIEIGDELLVVKVERKAPKEAYRPKEAEPQRLAEPLKTVRAKSHSRPQGKSSASKKKVDEALPRGDPHRKQTDRYPDYARAVKAAGGFSSQGQQESGGHAALPNHAQPVPAADLVRTSVAPVPDVTASPQPAPPRGNGASTPADLLDKLQRLSSAKRVQVEDFIDFLFWNESERYPQALQQDLLGVGEEAARELRHMRRSTDVLVSSFQKEQRWTRVFGGLAVVALALGIFLVIYLTPHQKDVMPGAAGATPETSLAAGATEAVADSPPPVAEARDEQLYHYHVLTKEQTSAQLAMRFYVRPRWGELIAAANKSVLDRGLSTTIAAGVTVRIPRFLDYRVEPDQSLSWIAKRLLGDPLRYKQIYEANRDKLVSPTAVDVGMVLRVPLLKPEFR